MNKYQKNIMERASRNLTNRADGANETIILENADPNVDAGIDKFYGVTVTNNTEAAVAIAVVPANFDTERLVINDGAVIRTFDNIDALRTAGYNVGAVLADGTASYTSTDRTVVNMTCSANDPTRTIKQFLDYIKLNPQRLKHLDIITSNTNMWATNLEITFCNPFFKNKTSRVQLNTFFSRFQYQSDRLGIDFKENQLEFSDLLLLTAAIPASATVQFIMTF